MAIIHSTAIGEAQGQLGDMIFYKVGGQLRVRMKPTQVKDKKSPKQLAQRARVRGVADLYSMLDPQIVADWKMLTEGTTMNGYNLFMSRNIKNIDGEGKVIKRDTVCITQGDLEVPQWVRMEPAEDGKMLITWDKAHGGDSDAYYDRLQIAVHSEIGGEYEEIVVTDENAAYRKDGQYLWQLPEVPGVAYVYGFFRGKYYQNDVSDSFYLGAIGEEEAPEEEAAATENLTD